MKIYIVYCCNGYSRIKIGAEHEVTAEDESLAAKLVADIHYRNVYVFDSIHNPGDENEIDFCVVDPVSEIEKVFRVSCEMEPAYYAREITGQSEPQS